MKKSILFFFFLIIAFSSFAAKVDTIEVYSNAMGRSLKTAIVTPNSYNKNSSAYPVLYLLHGGSGSYRDWHHSIPDKSLLHKLADQYNLIIVTPDGGTTSYYFDSPTDKTSQYETFISKELIESIDKNYRTIKDRKGRVIAGLSMGGHGAFFLVTKHPDLYSAAGSMSGVMDINTAQWVVPAEFAESRKQNFIKLLGPESTGEFIYPNNTMIAMVSKMKTSNVKYIFDCGVDDFLIKTNRALHERLVYNGIPHEYIERPGKHEWPYWENALYYQVLFMHKVLEENGANVL
ncbi:alpha/beta hydrolase [Albibacterium bauzanense]|uniref:S-formylglutathione hydrolase FrmB n=1 Tax=Albibacterium bauzanense TaxID=653929 RepID=A0A4R1LZF9_9SPHI|nr:alpha/beta hydrolase family protein [Albibacterium bauzanense]TCK84968.1 S-formylglutathione hydrolase FrmB [Albibacterium bauzanense]